MNCEHYSEDWETCTNADCPYCADYCPVSENPEVCRYSGLDDTEMMLRKCLSNEQEDHQQALQALVEENRELREAIAEAQAALERRVCCE